LGSAKAPSEDPHHTRQLASMFEDAEIRDEKWMGLTKSIMAVKTFR
jgi:hypothetical protein